MGSSQGLGAGMNQPTLGLLETLRPPPGFRTGAALGTTYSADLLTCMAVLTTLDGGDGEQVRYGRVEAYRALDRLRDKVRIYHHAGRISRRDGAKFPSLALLDRMLVPVRLPGSGSFHPKVWLVRQLDEAGGERFVLVVSSRNITTSTDWDLGIAVVGALAGGGVVLPRVRAFVEHTVALSGESNWIETFGRLDDVRWNLPPHTRELAFDFQAGGDGPRHLHREWGGFAKAPSRVLLLSPFIDDRMVGEAATRWRQVATRRLVAGTGNLLAVSLGPQREALRTLDPRQIIPASEAPDSPEVETGEEDDDEIEETRALHAKVIALDDGRHATVVIGSNNLTSAGWCGGSTEAFVRLGGDSALCDPLWDWSGANAELFDFPAEGTAPPEPPILERVKDALHAVHFRLEESPAVAPGRLEVLDPPTIDLPSGVRLDVARFTTPGDAVSFPCGASGIEFPTCAAALRTRFVVCTLRHGDDETAWIAAATLEPPVDDERDRALVARLLGAREFLTYLQSLGSTDVIGGTVEGGPEHTQPHATPQDGRSELVETVNLEGLLRQLVEEPQAFEEMDRAVRRYGELLGNVEQSSEDQAVLGRFLEAWAAISEAFR